MNEADRPTLKSAIGARVRVLREQAGLTQDALVLEARRWSLPWTRSTLTKIELGDRSLAVEELPLLAGALKVPMVELVPPGPAWLWLLPGAAIRGDALRGLLVGADPGQLSARNFNVEWSRSFSKALADLTETADHVASIWPDAPARTIDLAREAAAGETERRAARRLGLHPEQVATLAYRRWGMSLTAKREQRLREQKRPEDAMALRGHVTRALVAELVAVREKFAKQNREVKAPRRKPAPGASRREQILSMAADAKPLPKRRRSK